MFKTFVLCSLWISTCLSTVFCVNNVDKSVYNSIFPAFFRFSTKKYVDNFSICFFLFVVPRRPTAYFWSFCIADFFVAGTAVCQMKFLHHFYVY